MGKHNLKQPHLGSRRRSKLRQDPCYDCCIDLICHSPQENVTGLCILSFNPKLSSLCTTAFVGGPSSLHWSLNIHRDVPYYKRNESLQAVIWQSYCCREPFTKTFIHLPGSHRKGGTQKRFQFQLATYRVLDHNIPTHRSGHRSLC